MQVEVRKTPALARDSFICSSSTIPRLECFTVHFIFLGARKIHLRILPILPEGPSSGRVIFVLHRARVERRDKWMLLGTSCRYI